MYAWALSLFGLDSLYAVSVAYFILTIISVFLLSRSFFQCTPALYSSLFFASLPTVLVTISSRSLYPDISFLLFFLTTLYTTVRIHNTSNEYKSHWLEYAVFAFAFTLLFLTKSEFGLLLGPMMFAVLVLSKGFPFWEEFSIFAMGLPYYVREARNTLIDSASSTIYLGRLAPIVIVSVLAYILLKTSGRRTGISSFRTKNFSYILMVIFPIIAYLAYNIARSGFIIPALPVWNTQLTTSVRLLSGISPSQKITLADVIRFEGLGTWWFVGPFVLPLLIGTVAVVHYIFEKRRIDSKKLCLLLFSLSMFTMWTQLGCDPQPRRLYYLVPFACLLIAYGFYKISKFYSSFAFALRTITYVFSTTLYIWTRIGVETVNEVAYFYQSIGQSGIDIELLVVSCIFFLTIFAPYESFLAGKTSRFRFSKKVEFTMMFMILLFNAFLFSVFSSPLIMGIFDEKYQSRYKDSGGWLYYPDVVEYFNDNITDDYATIGFYCNELITFANRSVIDLYLSSYGSPIYSVVSHANQTQVIETLRKLNVGYFLKPVSTNPTFSTYEKLVNTTVLKNVFENNPVFQTIKAFKQATMYRFRDNYSSHPLNYSGVALWNYDPEKNFTLITERNVTKISGTTNIYGSFSVMYIFDTPVNISDSLWMTVESNQSGTIFIQAFTNLEDRDIDYLSYKFQSTGLIRSPIISMVGGDAKGNFDPSHIEGILVGLEIEPNRDVALEISNVLSIVY